MSKVDHADDAVDHRVADGDQPVDRPKGQAVDHLLHEGDGIGGHRGAPSAFVVKAAAAKYWENSARNRRRGEPCACRCTPVTMSAPKPCLGLFKRSSCPDPILWGGAASQAEKGHCPDTITFDIGGIKTIVCRRRPDCGAET